MSLTVRCSTRSRNCFDMIIDPKYNKGDIIASVYAKPGTVMGIARRFDNISEFAFASYVLPIIKKLVDDGYLRECKNGMIYARKRGIEYIKEHGYFD